MTKKCVICDEEIIEEYGKLRGTCLKIVEDKKKNFIYICSNCQKEDKWIEKAKVKSA